MDARTELAVEKVGRAIGALSGPLDTDALHHGWNDKARQSALRILRDWRDDLAAEGVVRLDHVMGWSRWLVDQGLPGTLTTDEKDARVELIRDLDLYVSRMRS